MLQLDCCEPITMELKHVTQRNTQPIRPQQNRCLRSPERPTKELVCAFDLLMILCVNFRSKMISGERPEQSPKKSLKADMSFDSCQGYALALTVVADHRTMIRLVVSLDEVTRLVTIIAIRKQSFQNLRHLQVRMTGRRHVLIRFHLQQNNVRFRRVRHANASNWRAAGPYHPPRQYP